MSGNRTVVVAGATGLIGQPLVQRLRADGYGVSVLTRRPRRARALFEPDVRTLEWDGAIVDDRWAAALEDAAGVVNLAGTPVGPWRWTPRRKREILESRIGSTRAIVTAIARLDPPSRPPVLVNSSGINYAGDRGDDVVTEAAAPGSSFLARVAAAWEEAALAAERLGVRVAVMRTPLVLARQALALRLMSLPYRLFVGGPLGSGRQWTPWIHLDDAVGLYRLALEDATLRGPVNVVAPDVRRHRELARELARALGRPGRVRVPEAALAAVLGEQAELFLDGQRAVPEKALLAGYRFRYADLSASLAEALR